MSENIRAKATRARDPFGGTTLAVEDGAGSIGGELVRLAAAELDAGNFDIAEDYLTQRLAENPDDHRALAYLAVCKVMSDPDNPTAETMALQAVTKNPDDPICYYALGQVCLAAGRRREAFRLFGRAHRLAASEKHLRRKLERLDPRRDLVFRSLKRDHPLNLMFGSLRALFTYGRLR